MQIQISWLLQKPTDLDLHYFQRQGISGLSRTRIKPEMCSTKWAHLSARMTKIVRRNDSRRLVNIFLFFFFNFPLIILGVKIAKNIFRTFHVKCYNHILLLANQIHHHREKKQNNNNNASYLSASYLSDCITSACGRSGEHSRLEIQKAVARRALELHCWMHLWFNGLYGHSPHPQCIQHFIACFWVRSIYQLHAK